MSDKEYYIHLLQKIVNVSSNLQRALTSIDESYVHLKKGLGISSIAYNDEEINNIRNDISNKLDIVNNVLIPTIKSKVDSL